MKEAETDQRGSDRPSDHAWAQSLYEGTFTEVFVKTPRAALPNRPGLLYSLLKPKKEPGENVAISPASDPLFQSPKAWRLYDQQEEGWEFPESLGIEFSVIGKESKTFKFGFKE